MKSLALCCFAALTLTAQQVEFEAAAVKPNHSAERMDYGVRGSRLWGRNMSVKGWIEIAYGVRDYQITGPAWISDEKFDIEAKIGPPYRDSKLMLQSLLADRFQLKLHRTTQESSAYALTIAKTGLKMKPSKDQSLWGGDYPNGSPDGRPVTWGSPAEFGPGRLRGDAIPMTMFTTLLSDRTGRKVINQTGLTGRYEIDLTWLPDSVQLNFEDPSETKPSDSTPSLATALRQLGLRLEPTKAPVDILVIDHIERPGEN